MTSISFRPAARENVGLLIGLAGASGSGKTFSAMRLASGIVGAGKRFAVIDTEARRALHYADAFAFDHAELRPPFRPGAYVDAIKGADEAGYAAIVIDSMSHEWAGEGGVLDWQLAEFQRLGSREATKLLSWAEPKKGHKAMVSRLLQSCAHLIFCLRAEERVKPEKDAEGKTRIVPIGWQPVCAKDFPFELTVSAMLEPGKPGIPAWLKLQEQHRPIFPSGTPIDEAAGARLAAWASGAAVEKPAAPPATKPAAGPAFNIPDDLKGPARAIVSALRGAKAQALVDDILKINGAHLLAIKAADEAAYEWIIGQAPRFEAA